MRVGVRLVWALLPIENVRNINLTSIRGVLTWFLSQGKTASELGVHRVRIATGIALVLIVTIAIGLVKEIRCCQIPEVTASKVIYLAVNITVLVRETIQISLGRS